MLLGCGAEEVEGPGAEEVEGPGAEEDDWGARCCVETVGLLDLHSAQSERHLVQFHCEQTTGRMGIRRKKGIVKVRGYIVGILVT